jgi:hypothetical protein
VAGLVWTQVTEAIALAQSGDVARGREALERCWEVTTTADHAIRCVVAHYLADLQTDLGDEIVWDERALAELPRVRDEDLSGLGIASAAGLAPSLHLNLGDGYLRRGDLARARQHLDAGQAGLDALADDPYGVMIRRGFERLAARIAAPGTPVRRR